MDKEELIEEIKELSRMINVLDTRIGGAGATPSSSKSKIEEWKRKREKLREERDERRLAMKEIEENDE